MCLWACGTTDPGKLDASVDASSTPVLEDAGVEDAESDAYPSDATISPLTK